MSDERAPLSRLFHTEDSHARVNSADGVPEHLRDHLRVPDKEVFVLQARLLALQTALASTESDRDEALRVAADATARCDSFEERAASRLDKARTRAATAERAAEASERRADEGERQVAVLERRVGEVEASLVATRGVAEGEPAGSSLGGAAGGAAVVRPRSKRQAQRAGYLGAAIGSAALLTTLGVSATWARFTLQTPPGEAFPVAEFLSTVALVGGAAVGMEYWARWAHKYLWHASMWVIDDSLKQEWNKSVWGLHESHHLPREGAFEANDIFALINAVPAIALCAYGFFHQGELAGLAFGSGLGVTLFGMAYMFVHDGLIHKRFPVGPIAKVPYFQRIEAGHKIHHSDKYGGAPFGLFLAEDELEQMGLGWEIDDVLEAQAANKKR